MFIGARCVVLMLGSLFVASIAADEEKTAADIKRGYLVPKHTCSPNERYAVTVPIYEVEDPNDPPKPPAEPYTGPVHGGNDIILSSSGKTVAEIKCEPGYNRSLNHHGTGTARWSKDSSLLLWRVPGKWFDDALVLVKIEKDRAKWQLDLMKLSQQAILTRTRKAEPKKYAAAKKSNEGSGSAYPEGFTVCVDTDGKEGETVKLPLAVHVSLTANPKGIPGEPELDSSLEAVVAEDGKFVVKSFAIEKTPPRDDAE